MWVIFPKALRLVAHSGEVPAHEVTTSPSPAQEPGKTGRNLIKK